MRYQLATALVLLAAVTLLVPSVETTAREFRDYHYNWEPPWELFTHPEEGTGNRTPAPVDERFREPMERLEPLAPLICGNERTPTWTEVTEYPDNVRKNESFTVGGVVRAHDANGAPVPNARVSVYLNETKTEPGEFLGEAVTDADGNWRIETSIPFPLTAQRYHVVNKVNETRNGCRLYTESWSDPEMDVFSGTRLDLACPQEAVARTNFTCTGRLLDDVGAGVNGREIALTLDGESLDPVRSGSDGTFTVPLRLEALGPHTVTAVFQGDDHYARSTSRVTINATLGQVTFDGVDEEDGSRVVPLVRGSTNVIEARVTLGDEDLAGRNVTLVLEGVPRADCHPGCERLERTVTLRADGTFEFAVDVPADAPVGEGVVRAEAPFIEPGESATARVVKGVRMTVTPADPVSLWARVPVTAHVVDDTGAPVADAPVRFVLEGGAGEAVVLEARTNGDGDARVTFPREPLGDYEAHAFYEGDDAHEATHAEAGLAVVVPWWYWAGAGVLLAGAAFATWRGTRRLGAIQAARARIEPLAITITRPDDAARARVGEGEEFTFLVPRVPGATAVRVHAPDAFEAPTDEPYPRDADAPARVTLRAARTGEGAVSVAAVDADGTVLARGRTRVASVRYAEDVENAYRALVRRTVGADAAEHVTPRAFEAFMRSNAPDLPEGSLARLVSVFEVADYSQHAVTRADYVRFRTALRNVRESPIRGDGELRHAGHEKGVDASAT